jgi:glycosyltransferase involved in cell wall biosynthesis
MTSAQKPWLTIATVVKDDVTGFELTLKSLIAQDLDGVEFLIVDGSTNTGEIPQKLSEIEIEANYSWSVPRGIYPAMNEALRLAKGKYIYFANAGDALHNSEVLANVGAVLRSLNPTWAYGNVRFASEDGRVVVPPDFDYRSERKSLFAKGRFPPHQGVFVETEQLRRAGGFDESFGICADYLSILKLSTISEPLVLTIVVADFYTGGVSSLQWKTSLAEFHRARKLAYEPRGLLALQELIHSAGLYLRLALAHLLGRA